MKNRTGKTIVDCGAMEWLWCNFICFYKNAGYLYARFFKITKFATVRAVVPFSLSQILS